MTLRTLCAFALGMMCASAVSAQWIVNSLADLPDADIDDAVYAPQTLRSAIQNANKAGVATTISISPVIEFQTIQIASGLPMIIVPTTFVGKGVKLEPSAGSSAQYGLWFTGNGSKIKDVQIKGFNGTGLVWQASNGLIEGMIIRDNEGPGINMNNAVGNVIGGELHGYYSNYIYGHKGNGGNGISMIIGSDNNTIQFTAIGVTETYRPGPNSRSGIFTECSGHIIRQNVISGNEYDGIQIDGRGVNLNTIIERNLIGTNELGFDTIPNLGNGISIFRSGGDRIENNIVGGNKGNGIYVADVSSSNVTIVRNKVGINRSNNKAVPNGNGIRLNGFGHTVTHNVISGNISNGISTSARDTDISDNIIGLDSTQKVIYGNGAAGIVIQNLDSSIVGPIGFSQPNVVAGNLGHGISCIGSKGKGMLITGNIIGTDSSLKLVAPNGKSGVFVTHDLSDLQIKDNIIAYSGKHGVEIERNVVIFIDTTRKPILQRPFDVHVTSNLIGYALTNLDSAGAIGGSGISVLNAEDIFIQDNFIFSCAEDGILIANDSTLDVTITGNDIGDYSGNGAVRGHGVHVMDAANVTIGAADDPDKTLYNNIVNCGGFAIRANAGTRNMQAYQNETCDNVEGGIELDNSALYYAFASNDNFDGDEGANGLQNTPDLAYGRLSGGVTRIRGWLEGEPGRQYRFDVYLDKEHAPGSGELNQGCIPVGSFTETAGWRGVVRIDRPWGNDLTREHGGSYPLVTLTATGIEGTSQFSLPPYVLPPDDTLDGGIDVAVYIDTSRSGVDSNGAVQLYATIENLGFETANNVVLHDSLLGAFAVDSASIVGGTVEITSTMVTATIPQLPVGGRVEYVAIGRSTMLGENKRSLFAASSGIDLRPRNNYDTTLIKATVVNGVTDNIDANVRITTRDRSLHISSRLGSLNVWVTDLTGRAIASEVGDDVSVLCSPGVYIVRVIGVGVKSSHSLVLVE